MRKIVRNIVIAAVIIAGFHLGAGGRSAVAAPSGPQPPNTDPGPEARDMGTIRPFEDPEIRLKWVEPHYPLAPLASGASDQYGYLWEDGSGLYDWIDAASLGEEVVFTDPPDLDEGFSEAIDIGFDFDYYENTYTQLYASTNGLITFGDGTGTSSNTEIPRDTPPNNYLAVFWDDLGVGGSYNSGKMFYYQGMDSQGGYLVLEWSQVTRIGSSDPLTFQAVLYENGDTKFQYMNLTGDAGQAAVGIEDGDGTDGLLYLYRSAGLSPGQAILFKRPAPAYRVKVLPDSRGEFAIGGEAFLQVRVRNTGELGADTYNLSAVLSPSPDWSISYYNSNQTDPLSDTDGDGQIDTGPLLQGATKVVYVKVQHVSGMEVGQHLQFGLEVTSSHDPAAAINLSLQTALPASFAQASVDSEIGPGLHTVSFGKRDTYDVAVSFTGSTVAIMPLSQDNFLYLWEENALSGQTYTDLEYAIVDRFGKVIRKGAKLTSNAAQSQANTWHIMDRSPKMATISGQKLAIVWVRDIIDLSTLKMKSNVYLSVLDRWGEILVDQINLTQNSAWNDVVALDVPTYRSPAIAPLHDDFFGVSWVDRRTIVQGGTSNLAYAVYNSDGDEVVKPFTLTASVPDQTAYGDPLLVRMGDGRVLLCYSLFDYGSLSYQIGYAVLDSGGNKARALTLIPGAAGWGPDGVSLSNGDAMLAWTSTATSGVAYVLIDGGSYSIIGSPQAVNNPDNRRGGYVSVAKDGDDHSVLTWMDANWNQYLYYALVKADGSTQTPTMTFHSGLGLNPFITTSKNGQGNTSYDPSFRVRLPLIVNNH